MDGHFVPNLTFGAKTIKALRRRTEAPFDAHLMIASPAATSRSTSTPAATRSRSTSRSRSRSRRPHARSGRTAGRPVSRFGPATPASALEPYQELIDIVMVMTVEPGFGGQAFMRDAARRSCRPATSSLTQARGRRGPRRRRHQPRDRRVRRRPGADILVVGSALWVKGHDMAREIRLVKALADEGYQYGLNDGEPPIPRDRMVRFASLPNAFARQLMAEIEAGGVPVVMLRGDGAMNPDGVRDYDLLVPATVEALVTSATRRRGPTTTRAPRRGARRTSASMAPPSHRDPCGRCCSGVPRERRGSTARSSARSGRAGDPAGRRAGDDDAAPTPRATDRRAADLRGRGGPDEPLADRRRRRRAGGQPVHALRRHAPRPPAGVHGRRAAGAGRAALPAVLRRPRGRARGRDAGRSGPRWHVELVNDGPFTIWLDSADR